MLKFVMMSDAVIDQCSLVASRYIVRPTDWTLPELIVLGSLVLALVCTITVYLVSLTRRRLAMRSPEARFQRQFPGFCYKHRIRLEYGSPWTGVRCSACSQELLEKAEHRAREQEASARAWKDSE